MEVTKGKKIVNLKLKAPLLKDEAVVVSKKDTTSDEKIPSQSVSSNRAEVEKEKIIQGGAISREEKGEQIAELYGQMKEDDDWNIFEQASHMMDPEKLRKVIRWVLVCFSVSVLVVFAWFMIGRFFSGKAVQGDWYAVRLVNGERYFGKVDDVSADPMILSHAYSTLNDEDGQNNMQLVKRVKEAYGPTGTMNIFRSQIVYFEPLQPGSRVLQAIMDYEK